MSPVLPPLWELLLSSGSLGSGGEASALAEGKGYTQDKVLHASAHHSQGLAAAFGLHRCPCSVLPVRSLQTEGGAPPQTLPPALYRRANGFLGHRGKF